MDEPGKTTAEKKQIKRPHMVVFIISRTRRESTDHLVLVGRASSSKGKTVTTRVTFWVITMFQY